MSTMKDLRDQLLSDSLRTDLTAVCETAIKAAVRYYEDERWWFNERRATFGTTPDQARLPLPDDFLECDSLIITINNNSYPLKTESKAVMDELFVANDVSSQPERYMIYDSQIKLYPTPDATYSVTMSYQYVLPELTRSDSTVWTNEMFGLIRFHALEDIYSNTLHNAERAARAERSEMKEYRRLKKRNARFQDESPIRGFL